MTGPERRGEKILDALAGEHPTPSATICAWCGAIIKPGRVPATNHGICSNCLHWMEAEMDLKEGRLGTR